MKKRFAVLISGVVLASSGMIAGMAPAAHAECAPLTPGQCTRFGLDARDCTVPIAGDQPGDCLVL
jgi:hypothetical protein